MFRTATLALALAASAFAALPASAQYGAPGYAQGEPGFGHAPYGYEGSNSTLGRSCGAGLYPESFPDGNGTRCVPVGGSTEFINPRL